MTASVEANKKIVRRWVKEVFNEHRLDSVEKLKVPDYVDWNPYPGQDGALAGFKKVLAEFFVAFPDFSYEVDEELGEGDLIVCLGTWSGTHVGELNGMRPTGRQVSAKRIDIVRFADDKMAERWGTGNELQMLQLMGVLKPTAQAGQAGDPQTVFRRFATEVIAGKNLATVDELVDREAVQNAAGTAGLVLLTQALTDVRVETSGIETDGDTVTGTLAISGIRVGEPPVAAPNGPRVTVDAGLRLRLVGNRIVESTVTFDFATLASALGHGEARSGAAAEGTGEGAGAASAVQGAADSKVLVRRFMDQVFNQHRLAVIPQLIADGATDHLQESLTVLAILSAFPDSQVGFDRMIVEGDRVTVLANFAGTHTGEFMEIPGSGKGVITRTISIFTVQDGKITDTMYNFDFFPVLTQLREFPADAVHDPAAR